MRRERISATSALRLDNMQADARRSKLFARTPRRTSLGQQSLKFPLPGRLAQLGERHLDMVEVTGSSPVSPMHDWPAEAGLSRFWLPILATNS